MEEKQILGKRGEEIAAQFLEDKGYQLIEKNYRCKLGEIDLIAIDQEELVFVEVKTRGQEVFGTPGEAVNQQKKTHMYHVAEYYLMKHHIEDVFCRFDVMEINVYPKTYKLQHLKNCVLDKPPKKMRREEKQDEIDEFTLYSETGDDRR